MYVDKQFRASGDWALASDGLQWVLQRHSGGQWKAVSFVRSTKEILQRCMREKGCPAADQVVLLDGLPPSFDEWKASQRASAPSHDARTGDGVSDSPREENAHETA
jgi:hypothetical protein